jgi:tRNA 2-thiouridine synthesizing protein A
MKADESLNCLGFYCPIPIVQTARKIKELAPGKVLEVVADDMGIKEDMPNWCKVTGNECLGIEEKDGQYKVYVRKTAK